MTPSSTTGALSRRPLGEATLEVVSELSIRHAKAKNYRCRIKCGARRCNDGCLTKTITTKAAKYTKVSIKQSKRFVSCVRFVVNERLL